VKNCKWCDVNFETKISYQIYCSAECRNSATKENIAQRYVYTKRKKRIGKVRLCSNCQASLSIYNDDLLCSFCIVSPKEINLTLKEIKRMFDEK